MLFANHPVVIRGGGDLASGVVYQLHQAGFPVVVLELERPQAIRRAVSFASAVADGEVVIEGVVGLRLESMDDGVAAARSGIVAVVVSPGLPEAEYDVVVDARLAKRNIDTNVDQASLVVGLGPGFTAGTDCHVVIETKRGHRLGRVITQGSAAADTGVPGMVGGASSERVVRAPSSGVVEWRVEIGDIVERGATIGQVGNDEIQATTGGVVRGLITDGFQATEGLKIGDIDPRADRDACFEISDKARLVGAGVLGAILVWKDQLEE